MLHKVIIPVNFLETWPPECLAIQFASTQYIAAWKASEHETGQGKQNRPIDQSPDLGAPTGSTPTGEGYKYDYRVWDETNLKRVAKEIAERYRQTVKREQIAERRSKTSSLKVAERDIFVFGQCPTCYFLVADQANFSHRHSRHR